MAKEQPSNETHALKRKKYDFARSFVTIQWSKIPQNIWFEITIPEPKKWRPLFIPNNGKYACYNAYFTELTDQRTFTIVFPLQKLRTALLLLKPSDRPDPEHPTTFEFMKQGRDMYIRNARKTIK